MSISLSVAQQAAPIFAPTRDQLTRVYSGLVDAARKNNTATPMGRAPTSALKHSQMQGFTYRQGRDGGETMFVVRGQLYLNTWNLTPKSSRWEKIGPVPLFA